MNSTKNLMVLCCLAAYVMAVSAKAAIIPGYTSAAYVNAVPYNAPPHAASVNIVQRGLASPFYPAIAAPYVASSAPYVAAHAPYVAASAPYIAASAPYVAASAPYVAASAPYVAAHAPYVAPYSSFTPYASLPVAPVLKK